MTLTEPYRLFAASGEVAKLIPERHCESADTEIAAMVGTYSPPAVSGRALDSAQPVGDGRRCIGRVPARLARAHRMERGARSQAQNQAGSNG